MNKTDRLLAIVLELQGKGRQRAEDLAKTFETSKRTIYRDIQALCEAGVPLISIPGQGYSLMKGYFLPPLSFTSEEATMLLLGSEYMARNFDAQYRAAAQSASRKIASVLPEQLRNDVSYLQNSIYFIVPSAERNAAEHERLQQLRRALLERTTVRFNYYARYSADGQNAAMVREVDPYGLIYFRNEWLLTGYCHLRQDIRYFRLDRIDKLELLSRTFQRPGNFQVRENREDQARNLVVRVLFDQEVARWVREGPLYYTVSEEETAEGLLVTLKVRRGDELIQWLLGWGRHVHVLEPESLRERIADEAAAMVHNHQKVE
jgi:predicted DNA-binding transcriptional regulator YafY